MKKVLILFGGNSFEHLISCKSAKGVYENIDTEKFIPTLCGIDYNNNFYLYEDDIKYLENGLWFNQKNIKLINNIQNFIKEFDVVFPVMHGKDGEDGTLAGMLDMLNIKYVGSNLSAHSIGMDKSLTKIISDYYNIKQIPYIILNNKKDYIKKCENLLDYPLIIKPSSGGSSIGISVANNKKELETSVENAFKYDNKVIVEKFIKCRELECAVFKDKDACVSSIGEINSSNTFYDFDAKYVNESKLIIPAILDDKVKKEIQNTALKIFKFLNCDGISRIDFLYDQDNNVVYFNEINTMPGFTPISMYPKLFEHDGISYKDLITKLINSGLKKEDRIICK